MFGILQPALGASKSCRNFLNSVNYYGHYTWTCTVLIDFASPLLLQGTLSGDDLVVESPLSFVGGARARFGTSVAFLGDIDRDGYNGTSTIIYTV